MTNMTLAIPEDLHKIMRKHNEVKWSHVAREALWRHARATERLEESIKASGEEDIEEFAVEFGRKIKRGMAERLASSSTPTGPSPPSSEKGRAGTSSPANGSNS